MTGRLRRFLHLERPRAAGEDGAGATAASARIEQVERPGGAPGAQRTSGARLDRFAAPPPRPLELDAPSPDRRPFTRCARCGSDHHVAVVECSGCGERLDTDAQRAFNERLWAERLADAEREARDLAALEARRAEAAEDAGAARRALGETLAREVGRRERERLGIADGWPGGGSLEIPPRLFGPGGRWLLSRIPHPGARGGVALAALLGPPVLVGLGVVAPGPRTAPSLLAALVIAGIFFARPRRRS